jgi:hypothetical protein
MEVTMVIAEDIGGAPKLELRERREIRAFRCASTDAKMLAWLV